MKCPHCDNDIDEASFGSSLTFCPYCGEKLSAARPKGISFCPYCGYKLSGDERFCPECGKTLEAKLKRKTASLHSESEHTTATEVASEVVNKATKAVKGFFGEDRKMSKLYRQWAEHSDLPPEEIPKLEAEFHSIHDKEHQVDEASTTIPNKKIPTEYLIAGIAAIFVIVSIVIILVINLS